MGDQYAEMAEQIRTALASLAQAQDDGRTDDLVTLYTRDAVVEVPGLGAFEGTEALREAFTGWKPIQPQRHIVGNTIVTDWDEQYARALSDVVFIQRGESGWSVQVVAKYDDTFRNEDGIWLLCRRALQFIG